MAKQTKTGGAYSNYQVIKTGDTTGSSKALAQGAADIASTVVQNKKDLNATREKELERFNKAKKTIASQVQARETSKQNALLDAGAAIEGSTLSEDMRKDFTEGFKTEVNAIGEAQKVLDNPYASNEAKKKANESIFKAKGLIGNLNLTLKKSQEMQVAANANTARIQSYGKDYGYNSIEKAGVQDNGMTFAGWDSAQVGAKGTSMYLSKKDGQYFLGGNGGSTEAGDAWDYETDISSYNNPTYSTTTDYTPLIPEASQEVVNQMYQVVDGKSTGKIDPSLIMKNSKGEELTIMHTDDIQYTEIDPKTFEANIISSATTATARFDAINNVQDRNNVLLEQLKLTREEGKDLYNADSEISGPAMKKFKEGILGKIRGEALASLNLKEIGDKLYKVSDVQPEKPTVTKADKYQLERQSSLNVIYSNINKISNADDFKTKKQTTPNSAIADRIINSLAINPAKGMKLTATDDGNLMFSKKVLDEAAMAAISPDIRNPEFNKEGALTKGDKLIPNPDINKLIYKEEGVEINIASGNSIKNINNLMAFLKTEYSLSSEQAQKLAETFLNKK